MKRLLTLASAALPALAVGFASGMYFMHHVESKKAATLEWGHFIGRLDEQRALLELLGQNNAECGRRLLEITLASSIKAVPGMLELPLAEKQIEMLRASSAAGSKVLEGSAKLPEAQCRQ